MDKQVQAEWFSMVEGVEGQGVIPHGEFAVWRFLKVGAKET